MNEEISQYYITQAPTITDISMSANPISAGASLTITISESFVRRVQNG